MAKLVITTGDFIAHGLNALAQEVIDTGACPGFLPAPVASTLLLPTNWNGLGAPADMTIGIVNQTDAAGIYIYVAQVDGLPFDQWLDSYPALRGVTYWRETGGSPAPLRVSVRIGGDTVAAIGAAARNWSLLPNTGGSITDVGAGATAAIRLTGTNQGGGTGTNLFFFNLNVSVPGRLLLIVKGNYVGPVAPSNFGAWGWIKDRKRQYRLSWNRIGNQNEIGYPGASALTTTGAGLVRPGAAFDRTDFFGSLGYNYAGNMAPLNPDAPPFASGRLTAKSFDRGYVPTISDLDVNADQAAQLGGSASCIIAAESGALASTSFDLQELHALRIL